MEISNIDAKAIVQDLLDRSGNALIQGDFTAFEQCISLPKKVETPEGTQTLKTSAELRAVFERNRRFLNESNVTDLIRSCLEAESRDDGTILSSHETRMVNGAVQTYHPYPCFMVLKNASGVWKISGSVHDIVDNPRLSAALRQD